MKACSTTELSIKHAYPLLTRSFTIPMFSRDHWNSSSQKIYMPLGINCTSVASIPTSVASSNPTTHI
ncbi:Uncharacterised protein [Vibrio cholerae]|nr:Uncharacterised protein [Vibrio cholerae]